MLKAGLILLIYFISISAIRADDLFADEKEETLFVKKENIVNKYDNLVGARFSNISGFGLSYARRFAGNYEVLVCGLVHYRQSIKWEDMQKSVITDETKDAIYDFGFEFKRDFITTSTTCVYGLIGAYYSVVDKMDNGVFMRNESSEKNFSAGIGIGLRVFLDKRFSANFNFGYKYDNIDKVENNQPDWSGGTYVGLGVGIDFGF